jgi:hypothetical protein
MVAQMESQLDTDKVLHTSIEFTHISPFSRASSDWVIIRCFYLLMSELPLVYILIPIVLLFETKQRAAFLKVNSPVDLVFPPVQEDRVNTATDY